MSVLGKGILGQVRPSDVTDWKLYDVTEPNKYATSKNLTVAEVLGVPCTFRIMVVQAKDTVSIKNAIMYDIAIGANTSLMIDDALILNINETIWVRSSVANALVFTMFGEVGE